MTLLNTTIDAFDRLAATDRPAQMLDAMGGELARLGVQGFGYAFTAMGDEIPEYHMFHTYGRAYDQVTDLDSPLSDDGTVNELMLGGDHLRWSDPAFVARLTPTQRVLYDAEQDIGLEQGVSLVLDRNGRGELRAGIGLWFDGAAAVDDAACARHWELFGAEMTRVASLFDVARRDRLAPGLIRLSARERDVISYLASGLRGAEISHRLGITDKTFEKHVANAKRKLRARTRDHAVAKAIVFGVVNL